MRNIFKYILINTLKYILIFLFFSNVGYCQEVIDIRDFRGVFTNADLEDIPKEYVTVLKNLRPINGKLVKTFAFGDKIDTLITDIANFTTFIESGLPNWDSTGYAYYAILIDTTTNVVTMKYYDDGWQSASVIDDAVTKYHNVGFNPIIFADDIMRILPGNVGEINSNQAKGIWYAAIDRKFLDQQYSISKAYYGYSSTIDKPGSEYEFETAKWDSGNFISDKSYKFSLIYDGVQESLLNDGFTIDYYNGQFLKLNIIFITANLPTYRITALNVYRADDPDGIYNLIHTIDFLRDSLQTFSGDSAWNGNYYAYIPDLITYNFDNTKGYEIDFDDYAGVTLDTPLTGTGHQIFKLDVSEYMPTVNEWDSKWVLYEWTGISGIGVAERDNGGFLGPQVIFIDTTITANNMAGGVLRYTQSDSFIYKHINKSNGRAIGFDGDSVSTDSIKSWRATSVINGNYFFFSGTVYDTITFFDTGLTEGAEYPLLGEVSTNINGKFAQIISGRLWQANIVLDPGDKNEVRKDWASYSELNQYDVNPVSNVISFANRGVGEITGLSELFGNPIILKNNTITLIDVKNYPVTPSSWGVIEAVHNIGNIAPRGYITVLGDLYICYYNGIYRLSANNLAETDRTPIEKLKISEPIGDVYDSLTISEKINIKSEYDQSKSEIIFTLGDDYWAYNVATNDWRQINSDRNITIMALDENTEILVYDSTTSKIYSFKEKDTVGVELKLKTFHIDDERKKVVRDAYITYKSDIALTLNVYTDNSDTVRKAITLPASDIVITYKAPLQEWAQKFTISLIDSTNSLNNTEIHKIKIY